MLAVEGRHHLARVVIAYDEENFERAAGDFAAALSIDFGPYLTPPGLGLRIAISLASGIEIIAAHGEEGYAPMMRQAVAERGEGVFGIVYRVPDLDAAITAAAAAGWPEVGDRIDCFAANPDWAKAYSRLIEANVQPIAGVNVTLIEGRDIQATNKEPTP
jgi:hypothetical protein